MKTPLPEQAAALELFLPGGQGQPAKLPVLPFPCTPVNRAAHKIPRADLALLLGRWEEGKWFGLAWSQAGLFPIPNGPTRVSTRDQTRQPEPRLYSNAPPTLFQTS